MARYSSVRRFFPALLRTIEFASNEAGEPVLKALTFLRNLEGHKHPDLLEAPMEVVPASWKRHVAPTGKPVDRRYYTLCGVWQGLLPGTAICAPKTSDIFSCGIDSFSLGLVCIKDISSIDENELARGISQQLVSMLLVSVELLRELIVVGRHTAMIAPGRRGVGKEQCPLATTTILWYPDA